MAADPDTRAEVEVAERLGISYKRLSGWEPTTFYEYDEQGRVVSSAPEPEWDGVEVGWMVELERWRRENVCPLCGSPVEICQAPEGAFVFGTEPPVRCRVTTALRDAQKAAKELPHPDALIHRPAIKPWGQAG